MVWQYRHRVGRKKRNASSRNSEKLAFQLLHGYRLSNLSPLKSIINIKGLICAKNIEIKTRRPCNRSPTSQPIILLAIHLQTFLWILNSLSPSIFLLSIISKISELSASSPVPPEDNRSYDEIFQSLEYLIESIRSSSPFF